MERNVGLDYFKLGLSWLVVALHTNGTFSEIPILGYPLHQGLTRIAVPCFFIINGYYIQTILGDWNKVKGYLIKLLSIYLLWMVIYIPYHHLGRPSLDVPYLSSILQWGLGWGHLWYVATLLSSVFILYFLQKWKIKSYTLLLSFIALYLVGLSVQRLYLVDIDFKYYIFTRTALSPGLLFIYIGVFIKEKNILNKIRLSYKVYFWCVILLLSIFVESYLPRHYNRATDYYIALPILCPIIVLIVLKKGVHKVKSNFVAKLSSAVYFSHFLILFNIESKTSLTNTPLLLVTILCTLVVSTIIVYANKRAKIFL